MQQSARVTQLDQMQHCFDMTGQECLCIRPVFVLKLAQN